MQGVRIAFLTLTGTWGQCVPWAALILPVARPVYGSAGLFLVLLGIPVATPGRAGVRA